MNYYKIAQIYGEYFRNIHNLGELYLFKRKALVQQKQISRDNKWTEEDEKLYYDLYTEFYKELKELESGFELKLHEAMNEDDEEGEDGFS